MPPKQKRKHLSLEQKKQLIADKDAGKSIDDLKKNYGIGKTAVYDIINDRKTVLKQAEDGADPKRKHVKLTDKPIDDATLSWFKTQRSKNVPINGPLIQVSLHLKVANFILISGKGVGVCRGAWQRNFQSKRWMVEQF